MAYSYIPAADLQVDKNLYQFIEKEVLAKHPAVEAVAFWQGFSDLVHKFAPLNRDLLEKRDRIQLQIDQWHRNNPGPVADLAAYKTFLNEQEYLVDTPLDFKIATENVDRELAEQAGPQLVVPINNARYALNAANARWGSLYDALYGTDAIDQSGDLAPGKGYNPVRGDAVIAFARDVLDSSIPLAAGSHKDVVAYQVKAGRLKPADKDLVIQALDFAEHPEHTTADFGEGDKKKPLGTALRDFLAAVLPVQLAGGEQATAGKAAGAAAGVAEFAEYADADALSHHERALAMAAKEGIAYDVAARRTAGV